MIGGRRKMNLFCLFGWWLVLIYYERKTIWLVADNLKNMENSSAGGQYPVVQP
jgi:hypothetical protein